MSDFVIAGKRLSFPNELDQYNEIRIKYQSIAYDSHVKFKQEFYRTFKDMDDLYARLEEVALTFLMPIITTAVRDCVNQKVYVDEQV